MDRNLLEQCNMTELVTLAADQDIRTHRGVGRDALIDSILTGAKVPPNPLDPKRAALMRILRKYEQQLKGQVSCHADCYRHTDGHVVRCAFKARSVFDREGQEKDQ